MSIKSRRRAKDKDGSGETGCQTSLHYSVASTFYFKAEQTNLVVSSLIIQRAVNNNEEVLLWLMLRADFGHISSRPARAHEMPGALRIHIYIADIDDRIQLHDYNFSQSFKWFIALNLNSEYIYRQCTGEAAARSPYWPVWSGPNKE